MRSDSIQEINLENLRCPARTCKIFLCLFLHGIVCVQALISMRESYSQWSSADATWAILSVGVLYLTLIGKWVLSRRNFEGRLVSLVVFEISLSVMLNFYVFLSQTTVNMLKATSESDRSGDLLQIFIFINVIVFYMHCGRRDSVVLEIIECLEMFGTAGVLAAAGVVFGFQNGKQSTSSSSSSPVGIILEFCGIFLVLVNTSSLSAMLKVLNFLYSADKKRERSSTTIPADSSLKNQHDEEQNYLKKSDSRRECCCCEDKDKLRRRSQSSLQSSQNYLQSYSTSPGCGPAPSPATYLNGIPSIARNSLMFSSFSSRQSGLGCLHGKMCPNQLSSEGGSRIHNSPPYSFGGPQERYVCESSTEGLNLKRNYNQCCHCNHIEADMGINQNMRGRLSVRVVGQSKCELNQHGTIQQQQYQQPALSKINSGRISFSNSPSISPERKIQQYSLDTTITRNSVKKNELIHEVTEMRESVEEDGDEKISCHKRFSSNLSNSRKQPTEVEADLSPQFLNKNYLLSIIPKTRSSKGIIFEHNEEEAKYSPKGAYSQGFIPSPSSQAPKTQINKDILRKNAQPNKQKQDSNQQQHYPKFLLNQAIDQLDCELIILDEELKIIYTNNAATSYLSSFVSLDAISRSEVLSSPLAFSQKHITLNTRHPGESLMAHSEQISTPLFSPIQQESSQLQYASPSFCPEKSIQLLFQLNQQIDPLFSLGNVSPNSPKNEMVQQRGTTQIFFRPTSSLQSPSKLSLHSPPCGSCSSPIKLCPVSYKKFDFSQAIIHQMLQGIIVNELSSSTDPQIKAKLLLFSQQQLHHGGSKQSIESCTQQQYTPVNLFQLVQRLIIETNQTSHKIQLLKCSSEDSRLEILSQRDIRLVSIRENGKVHVVLTFTNDLERHQIQNKTLERNIFQTISHEIGTYTNFIQTFVSAALVDTSVPDSVKKSYLKFLDSNAFMLGCVIQDIRSFHEHTHQKLKITWKKLCLPDFLASICKHFKKLAKLKEIIFKCELFEVPQQIYADELKLQAILVNLLGNAFKFTSRTGTVTVSIEFQKVENLIKICVTDTGIGMKSDEQSRLENLLSGHSLDTKVSVNSSGFGFGLTISSILVSMMPLKRSKIPATGSNTTNTTTTMTNSPNQNRIHFTSTESVGSSFWFFLDASPLREKLKKLTQINTSKISQTSFNRMSVNQLSPSHRSEVNLPSHSNITQDEIHESQLEEGGKLPQMRISRDTKNLTMARSQQHDHQQSTGLSQQQQQSQVQQLLLRRSNFFNTQLSATSNNLMPAATAIVPKIMEKFIILSNQELLEMEDSDHDNLNNNNTPKQLEQTILPQNEDAALKILPSKGIVFSQLLLPDAPKTSKLCRKQLTSSFVFSQGSPLNPTQLQQPITSAKNISLDKPEIRRISDFMCATQSFMIASNLSKQRKSELILQKKNFVEENNIIYNEKQKVKNKEDDGEEELSSSGSEDCQGIKLPDPQRKLFLEANKILIVDDEPMNVKGLEILIKVRAKILGNYIITASNGLEAIEQFKKHNVKLIFMDINMPLMDGITATKEIRELEKIKQLKRTTICAYTSWTDVATKMKCGEVGMDNFYTKPIGISTLMLALKKYYYNWEE